MGDTYNFNMTRFNTLDHFMLSGFLFDSAVESVDVSHSVDNTSDHDPLRVRATSTYARRGRGSPNAYGTRTGGGGVGRLRTRGGGGSLGGRRGVRGRKMH